MVTRTIVIPGLSGQEDADKVSRALHEIWGIRTASVDVGAKEAVFSFDGSAASMEDFQQAILELGFEIKTEDGEPIESFHDWQLGEGEGERSDEGRV